MGVNLLPRFNILIDTPDDFAISDDVTALADFDNRHFVAEGNRLQGCSLPRIRTGIVGDSCMGQYKESLRAVRRILLTFLLTNWLIQNGIG